MLVSSLHYVRDMNLQLGFAVKSTEERAASSNAVPEVLPELKKLSNRADTLSLWMQEELCRRLRAILADNRVTSDEREEFVRILGFLKQLGVSEDFLAELDYYKEGDCQKLYRISSKARFYEQKQCLDDIFVLSCMMKGGFNRPYFKGEVQKALWGQKLGSDKAFVKQKIFPNETVDDNGTTLLDWYQDVVCHGNDPSREKYPDHRYIRAMLGLADHYDYGVGKNTKKTIAVAAKNEEIARFANPVRFKPCQGGFRILVYEVPTILLRFLTTPVG